ncbi:hypothetical protein DFP72DRAFT_1077718 [Ephemerocybe angulata]|uniref:Uncharacterized protein n=1 Tax=Ephemerocybe angulata TaxID=980116 RepID=A0A8H6HGD3_9AGAR|nr:hypothetical protein DFP72DRAFT_1077718 [Tulosesus angulatus]
MPEHKYSGKDVRKAVYESHKEAERLKDPSLSSVEREKSPLKPFNNRPNAVSQSSSNPTPVPSMASVSKNPAREYPLPNKVAPGTPSPARVVTQKTTQGNQVFRAVIAHDQSRKLGSPGYNDHFEVREKKSKISTV